MVQSFTSTMSERLTLTENDKNANLDSLGLVSVSTDAL